MQVETLDTLSLEGSNSQQTVPRILGRIRGEDPGPSLIGIGGIHGNEPAGVRALEKILTRLHPAQLAGELIAVAGNRAALAHGSRFLHRDLNRRWLPERLLEFRSEPIAGATVAEDREQTELLSELETIFATARGPVFVVDLHTTSGPGAPFAIVGDTLRNRDFAMQLQVPVILGLEEVLEGTLLDFLENRGCVTLGFEGGQHQSPVSVDCCEAAVWIGLESAGLLRQRGTQQVKSARQLLAQAGAGLPRVLEVRYRHDIRPQDGFRMVAGLHNFQPVAADQILAHDQQGSISAPEAGRILMPLYQDLGDDGFFLVRRIRPLWLRLSRWLRVLRLGRLAPLLPGISRFPDRPEALVVDLRWARWFTLEVLHLLGYRRHRLVAGRLHVSRRREEPPEHLSP